MLQRGRILIESLMQTTVRIRHKTGQTRNQETGQLETTWTTVYEGPGRVRFTRAEPRDIDASGQRFAEQSPTVSLPIATSVAVDIDDEGEILANDLDPAVVGLRFRIAGIHEQTHSTARRFPVEVLSHG